MLAAGDGLGDQLAGKADGRVPGHAEVAAGQHLPGEGSVQPLGGVPYGVAFWHGSSLPEGGRCPARSVAPVPAGGIAVHTGPALVSPALAGVARGVFVRRRRPVVRVVGGVRHWSRRRRPGGVALAGIRVGPGDRRVVRVQAAGPGRPGAGRAPARAPRAPPEGPAAGRPPVGVAAAGKAAAGKLRLAGLPVLWLAAAEAAGTAGRRTGRLAGRARAARAYGLAGRRGRAGRARLAPAGLRGCPAWLAAPGSQPPGPRSPGRRAPGTARLAAA